MPSLVWGKFRIVAVADLGELGAKEGPTVEYDWRLSVRWPALLPWLGVVLLLCLKSNRRLAAVWICVPLLVLQFLGFVLSPLLDSSDYSDLLAVIDGGIFGPVAFAMAAVWLLGGGLSRIHRFAAFAWMLVASMLFGVGTLLLWWDAEQDWEMFASLMVVDIVVILLVFALALSALSCRSKLTLRRYSVSLLLWFIAESVFVTFPYVLLMLILERGGDVGTPLLWILGLLLAAYITALPFVILAFSSAFYKERLVALVRPATAGLAGDSA